MIMKKAKYLLVIGLALLFAGSSVSAQEAGAGKDYKFTLKVNPLNAMGGPFWVLVVPITGEYKVVGEAAIAKRMSLQVSGSYIGPSVLINLDKISAEGSEVSGIKTSGFKVGGMLKYFLSRDLPAPKGFYLGPHISFAKATITNKDVTTDKVGGQKINVNACIGYQMITSGGFTLDIFTGLGFVSRKWSYEGTSSEDFDLGADKNGVSIPLGVSFGYAF
jgi:hypothetical protein